MALERLKTFVFIFVKSLTKPEYYKEVLKTSPRFSVKYYFALMLILTLFSSAVIGLRSTPKAQRYATVLLNELSEVYPGNLEFTIKNGQFDINRPEPYFIPLPPSAVSSAPEGVVNLIVFDSEGTIGDLKTYKTLILVNRVNMLIQTPAKTDIYPLQMFPDNVITKSTVNDFVSQLHILVRYLGVFIFLFVATFMLFYNFIIRSLYLVIAAASLQLISRVQGRNLTFAQLYQISLHTATWPIVIEMFVVALIGALLPSFWFFMLILVLGNVVLLSLERA